jgi:hypothetical protein
LVKDIGEIRKEIASLASRKNARFVPRSPEMPCDWKPTTVYNPEVGMCFTDISAWHYIADLAESEHPMEEITLKQPEGEKAYEMIVKLEPNVPDLYIKVQLKGGKIFGRSFHYSTKNTR